MLSFFSTMMKIVLFLLLLFVSESVGHFYRYDRDRRNSPSLSGKYRISPKTGVKIALPSKYKLSYKI